MEEGGALESLEGFESARLFDIILDARTKLVSGSIRSVQLCVLGQLALRLIWAMRKRRFTMYSRSPRNLLKNMWRRVRFEIKFWFIAAKIMLNKNTRKAFGDFAKARLGRDKYRDEGS